MLAKLGYNSLPQYEEPVWSPISTPELSKKYPFILINGGRLRVYFHSCYREQEKLRKIHPDPIVQINYDTALNLGIHNGDWIYIRTPIGKIKQKAELNKKIHPKVIHAEYGWWFPEKIGKEPELFGLMDSNINVIIPDDPQFCDFAGDQPIRALLCNLSKT